MEFLKLKSGTDIRGVASDGVAAEPVTLTDEVVEAIAASFLVWCERHLEKTSVGLRVAVGHAGLRPGIHPVHVYGDYGPAL